MGGSANTLPTRRTLKVDERIDVEAVDSRDEAETHGEMKRKRVCSE